MLVWLTVLTFLLTTCLYPCLTPTDPILASPIVHMSSLC